MRADWLIRLGAWVFVATAATASIGCSSMNNTEKGALAGGAIGSGVGLLAGAATGNPGTGAAVGGLLGGGLGAVAGNDADRQQQREREVIQANAVAGAQAQQQRMGLTDVIQMAQAGHADAVIVNQIRNTGSTFQLSTSDLDFLKNNGVSGVVISEMQNARTVSPLASRVVRPAPATTVIVEEPYPPPVVFVRHPRPYYHAPRPVMYAGGYYRFR